MADRWWDVKIWFHGAGPDSQWESGGRFAFVEGDTWRSVLDNVIKLRSVSEDQIYSVEIALRRD